MTVPAEVGGRLQQLAAEGDVVKVGQTVARLDTDQAADAPEPVEAPEAPVTPKPAREAEATGEGPPIAAASGPAQAAEKLASDEPPLLSPAVRRLIEEHGLDASTISGTGKHGRLTKGDILKHLESRKPATALATAPPRQVEVSSSSTDAIRETRIRMSRLRSRIAERLVQVQQNAAILSTFNEVDMSAVIAFRSRHKDSFEKKFDVRLGFMSFFVKAAVDALKTVPQLNARIEGDEIVQQHYHDIGVAVGTEQGLVVPVIRDADQMSFAEIEKRIGEFAVKARERRLGLDDLTGGSFTISNGGIYGSLLSTPILNPPQSGILGMHRIQKRPVVTPDEQIVIRPMMYLALSYDHRIVDGAQAVTFLKRIVECVEDPERMLLEV